MLSLMLNLALLVLALFLVILACLETGWRIRARHLANETPSSDAGLSALSLADRATVANMALSAARSSP